jgi:nicotinamidase/pyrazinamidase
MKELETYDQVVSVNVDIQNDFCPGGSLAVADGNEVVAPMNQVNEWVRDNNGRVIFTRDWHPEQTPHFEQWPVHCVQGTVGAEFHPDLELKPSDTIASKGMGQSNGYSGWRADLEPNRTERVDEAIRKNLLHNRIALIVGGIATDVCVRATVLDGLRTASRFGDGQLDIFVVKDGVAAVNAEAGDGDKALEEMEEAGARLVTSEDVLAGAAFQLRSQQ